jgi:hypothetical protein
MFCVSIAQSDCSTQRLIPMVQAAGGIPRVQQRCDHAAVSPTLTKLCANAAITRGIAPRMTVDAEIFVVGAGPPGLTAAYCLTKETPSVIVIEKRSGLSGWYQPYRSSWRLAVRNRRPSLLLQSEGSRRSLARDTPERFHCAAAPSRIYSGGKFYSYPLSAFQALRNLGIFTGTACSFMFLGAHGAVSAGRSLSPASGSYRGVAVGADGVQI